MHVTKGAMARHVALYGIAIAVISLVLEWADFRHASHSWSTTFYVILVAITFAGLGAWLANRLAPTARSAEFQRNDAALQELNVSRRELDVLERAAEGMSTKLIARRLNISPNTVKTHLSHLFEKLHASNRIEAIRIAKALRIIP